MIDAFSEILSPAAREILNLESSDYSKLVVDGSGSAEAKQRLDMLLPGDVFIAGAIKTNADRAAVLAGLWLWHDWLQESHAISQSLHDATGSFWHAIMHRREGDFSNSKYWYAKASGHPAMAALGREAGAVVNHLPADNRLLRITGNGWNANALVDLVEAVHGDPGDSVHFAAVELQRLEWRALFRYCAGLHSAG